MKLGTVYLNATLKGAPLDEQEQYTKDAWTRDPNFELLLGIDMPDVISTACCATFIVHRSRVLGRPRRVYEAIRQWLMDTDIESHYSGRVMEYTWHILFGDPPVAQAFDFRSAVCEDDTSDQ